MRIDILGIYLAEYNTNRNNSIKKLHIENKELEKLSIKIEQPSQNRLPLFDSMSENIFSTSTRFKIEELSENSYLYFLKEFFEAIEEADDTDSWLGSLDDLFQDKYPFQPNVIIYKLKEIYEHEKKSCIYIKAFKNNMLMEDRTILFGKMKKLDNESGVNEIGVLQGKSIFVLPQRDFICSVEKEHNNNITLKVYNAMELDKLFSVEKLIEDYAEKKIRRFVSADKDRKFKLTRSNADVFFKDTDGNDKTEEVVSEIITSKDIHLKKTYATFSGRSTKTVQKIDLQRLSDVVEKLREYILNPQTDNLFTVKELPRINITENTIYVDEKSVKIFAAMLNNEIIQKLLDGTIEIPYYQEN
ncbi:hypothetical protein BW721_09850 [Jeotgalibaca sp. PTS2502]|uniref:hypothetical protein n=1 Tax=Jeotgalibaca sp. PTS2502 TaxID=1903686 RepID=UPI000973D1E4|nr:hypothetical protein [Jeotgalibaca sp. PTS2502]APZ49908.1 hypothetical protein BW721_09850 [Jeotgalibaca sp. PTS2502]